MLVKNTTGSRTVVAPFMNIHNHNVIPQDVELAARIIAPQAGSSGGDHVHIADGAGNVLVLTGSQFADIQRIELAPIRGVEVEIGDTKAVVTEDWESVAVAVGDDSADYFQAHTSDVCAAACWGWDLLHTCAEGFTTGWHHAHHKVMTPEGKLGYMPVESPAAWRASDITAMIGGHGGVDASNA